jgi:hypothetical protein
MAEKSGKIEISDEEYAKMVFQDGEQLIVNLEDTPEFKFEAIPVGIYTLEIDAFEFKQSQSSGKPMMDATWKIIDGPYEGRKFHQYLSLSAGALPGTKTQLMRIDPVTFGKPFDAIAIAGSGMMLGKRARGKIDKEEYQGEMRSKLAYIAAPIAGQTPGTSDAGGGNSDYFKRA